jgi:Rad3-related DNA helicase
VNRLSDHELDQLLRDAQTADAVLDARRAQWTALVPRIRRLLEEQRELREQAGERERVAAQEQGW